MRQTLIDLFTSKKFLAALTAIVVYAAGRFGFDVDTATLDRIFAAFLVYVGAQGIADNGKSAAAIAMAPVKPAAAPFIAPSALLAGSGPEAGTALQYGRPNPDLQGATGTPAATAAMIGATVVTLPTRDPQAGFIRRGLAALLAALGIPLIILACTAAQVRQTTATGTVAALDCELVHVDQSVADDLRRAAEAKVQAWISGTAPADLGALIDRVKADLAVFRSDAGRCAIAGVLAAATTITSPTPGEATSALTAAARPDPVAVRAAFSTAARELGLPPFKVAGGAVL